MRARSLSYTMISKGEADDENEKGNALQRRLSQAVLHGFGTNRSC